MAAAAGTRVQLPEPKSLPLGPATNKLNQPRKVDTALLRPALTTTVTGMRQAIHALETGTLEVRSYLLNEVNLIYECKVCHNMFRSLVNLIAHKRSFCKQQYKQVTHFYDDQDNTKAAELETVVIEAEPIETVIQDDAWEIENYAPSLNLLKDADILQDIQSRPLINRLLPPKKQGLAGVVASLRAKVGNKDAGYYENQCRQIEARKSEAEAGTLYIEPISETSNGLFQTWKVTEGEAPTTGENYRVIQEKEKGISVTVSENGTAMPRGVPAELENWRERNGPVSPGSEGSKENHEDVAKQTKFQCPECKKLFTLVKTVVKHLVKFHNKTTDQAKLLRKKIKNNAITVKDITPKTIEFDGGVLAKMQEEDSESVLGRPKKEVALSLAMAIGLIDKNGQGRPQHFNPAVKWNMNNIKKEFRKEDGDQQNAAQPKVRGRPKKHRESEDDEVSFNHSPESKRAKLELDRSKGYCSGKFKCDLADCGKTFKTPTFLLQHYVGHFKVELQEEYEDDMKLGRCSVCNNSFKTGPLIVHIGATHKKVLRYLPNDVSDQFEPMSSRTAPTTPVKNDM